MTLFIIVRLIYEAYFRFPHFKILKAGMRKWIHKNSDEVVTYQISLKTKKPSSELVFEELWINEKRYKFFLRRSNKRVVGTFSRKEILNLDIIGEINTENEKQPLKSSKGKLILSYSFRNKRKYFSFKKFRGIEDIRLSGTQLSI